jgi:hypothetical protein
VRWRRGFFRLWILFSVLWVAGAILISLNQGAPYYPERALYFAANENAPRAVELYSDAYKKLIMLKEQGSMTAIAIDPYPEVTLFLKAGKTPDEINPFIDRAAAFQKQERDMILIRNRSEVQQAFLALGLGVPLGLLAFGSAIAWVLGGFRRS